MVAEHVELDANGFTARDCRFVIAQLLYQLPANFGRTHTGVEALIPKLRIGLTLPVHNRPNVSQKRGEDFLCWFLPKTTATVHAFHSARQLVFPFANRLTAPAKLTFCQVLAARAKSANGPGHK